MTTATHDQIVFMDRILDHSKEPYIQVPNMLIRDMYALLKEEGQSGYLQHGYSFIITSAFLYKYTNYIDFENNNYINITDIKMLSNINKDNRKVNAVTKKSGGILESYGIIDYTNNIPIYSKYSEEKTIIANKKDKNMRMRELKIFCLKESSSTFKTKLYNEILKTKSYYVPIPVFMENHGKNKGTLSNYANTYKITYDEYRKFMYSNDLNLKDFLLYSYLKSKGCALKYHSISASTIKNELGISKQTLLKTTSVLECQNMIKTHRTKQKESKHEQPKRYKII